jgi:L-ascorbate oxidase
MERSPLIPFCTLRVLAFPLAVRAQIKTLANPVELVPTRTGPHTTSLELDVRYADFTMYNPATQTNDKVHLRTYNGQPVGPTIRMLPGDILSGTLDNQLPSEGPLCDKGEMSDHNTPNCFNTTNLHTHGFHVSPSGISDNVLLQVFPQKNQPYKIELPSDHPAGTFWYHSHRHGSTALQVSSGMEGALIVTGTRTYADKLKNGGLADIDTVLKQAGKPVTERVLLFQQVQYNCIDSAGKPTWDCAKQTGANAVGRIESYNQFGPSSWAQSGRYTTINGLVQPNLPAHAGEIYRWRLLHGGIRDTVALRITRSSLAAPNLLAAAIAKGVAPAQEQDFVNKYCRLDQPVPQFEFAADGLTRASMSAKIINVLQPGYRSDILTVFPEKGVFCVLNDGTSPAGSVNSIDYQAKGEHADEAITKGTHLLALVQVTGNATIPTAALQDYIGQQLYISSPELPSNVREPLRKLQVAEFSPHQPIPDSAHMGTQLVDFDIAGDPAKFMVNGKPFSDDPADTRILTLGGTDQWKLSSKLANHPFHIHVNPFEVVRITKTVGDQEVDIFANGRCTELDLKDKDGKPTPDPQYCDQIGVFRDTIFVKQGYQIYVRSHYTEFDGAFVLHCHILDHEDQGMMQNVVIQGPGTPSAAASGATMGAMSAHHMNGNPSTVSSTPQANPSNQP